MHDKASPMVNAHGRRIVASFSFFLFLLLRCGRWWCGCFFVVVVAVRCCRRFWLCVRVGLSVGVCVGVCVCNRTRESPVLHRRCERPEEGHAQAATAVQNPLLSVATSKDTQQRATDVTQTQTQHADTPQNKEQRKRGNQKNPRKEVLKQQIVNLRTRESGVVE